MDHSAASDNKDISVIIPAFNAAAALPAVLESTYEALEGLGSDFEIVVVDDGSTDETLAVAERASASSPRIKLISSKSVRGKGGALKRGFEASSRNLVCFLDSDPDLRPSQVVDLLARMDETGADIVIASKRHPDAILDYPWYRKLYSTLYYFMVLLMFRLPVKDTQTGIKLFRRDVLVNTFPRLVIKRFAFDLEMLVVAHKLGHKIVEAPARLGRRRFGWVGWSDIQGIIVDTMAIFFRLYVLRYYDGFFRSSTGRQPSVSIIIPAKVLDAQVQECVDHCRDLDYQNREIVLILDEWDPSSALDGYVVMRSGSVGPSIKRNMASDASSAEILAFIDSDAWPEPDWLRDAVSYFDDPEVGAVCGPAVTPIADSRRQKASGLLYSSSMVSGRTTYRYARHKAREIDDFPSCNLMIRRSDFEKASGYPEEFWPGEDTVLCLRITHDLGKKMLYAPNAAIYHHRRPLLVPHAKQVFSYARQRGYFVRKFPQTSRRLQYFVPSLFVLLLVVGFGVSFLGGPVLYAYLSFLGLYLALAFLSSIKSTDLRLNLTIFLGIIATNIVYGAGFIRGILSRGMERS